MQLTNFQYVNFIHFFVFLAISIILTNCQKQNKTSLYTFISTEKASFPADTLTKPTQINIQVIEDTLIILNQEQNSLLFYSISKEKLLDKINFKREGANGVPVITGFLYHTPDSIFLLSAYQYKLYLFNKNAILIDKYNLLKSGKIDASSALAKSNLFSKMEKIKDEIHISTTPYLKPESKEFYKSKRIHQVINLKTRTYYFLSITYPKIYQENAYPYAFSNFYRCYNPEEQKFIYSFMADNKIMVIEGKHSIFYDAHYEQMQPPTKLKNFTYNEDEHLKVQKESNHYHFILYDKYRKMYYRIAQKNEERDKVTLAIIVLDANFKKILEYPLPSIDKKTIAANFLPPFVGIKGLYVSNPKSQTEDFFEMNIFKLIKKEQD